MMKRYLNFVVIVSISLFVLNACIDIENPLSVQTGVATDITSESAVLNGNINFEGGSEILSKGFLVSEDDDIDENDYVFYDEDVSSSITISVSGMQANTTYFFKAFATNSSETAYGAIGSVTTLASNGNATGLVVQTIAASEITGTSAKLNASISSDDSFSFIEKGFFIDLNSNLDENSNPYTVEEASSEYSLTITGLSPSTSYFFRAYAKSSEETIMGEILQFTTIGGSSGDGSCSGSFTDSRDNHIYNCVTIGEQTWMAENLAYLPSVSPVEVGSNYEANYYVYDYNGTSISEAKSTNNYKTYGVLYNWHAAQNACPSGWHLPSMEEWNLLEDYIYSDGHPNEQGKALKADFGWDDNGNGTNDYGFAALPGGERNDAPEFYDLGSGSYYLSSDEDGTNTEGAFFESRIISAGSSHTTKDVAGSVRCIKD